MRWLAFVFFLLHVAFFSCSLAGVVFAILGGSVLWLAVGLSGVFLNAYFGVERFVDWTESP